MGLQRYSRRDKEEIKGHQRAGELMQTTGSFPNKLRRCLELSEKVLTVAQAALAHTSALQDFS
jgi:hypothetical protein